MRLEQDLLQALGRQETPSVRQSAPAQAAAPSTVAVAVAVDASDTAGGAPAYGAVVLFMGQRMPQASLDTVLAAYHDGMA